MKVLLTATGETAEYEDGYALRLYDAGKAVILPETEAAPSEAAEEPAEAAEAAEEPAAEDAEAPRAEPKKGRKTRK